MFLFLKNYISQHFSNDCCLNIPLTTKRIKEVYSDSSNSKIFDELLILENKGVISIKQAARRNKCYKEREDWLSRKHKICRYLIDILNPEYFWQSSVSETNWAIKAYVDTENWKFIIKFNGLADITIDLKSAKGNKKTLIMEFWETQQNNANQWCECKFQKPHTSIDAFFGRFCKELKPFFIEFEKGGYKARFTPIVYSDMLKHKAKEDFIFYDGKENRQHYKCKFDESGQFVKWIEA